MHVPQRKPVWPGAQRASPAVLALAPELSRRRLWLALLPAATAMPTHASGLKHSYTVLVALLSRQPPGLMGMLASVMPGMEQSMSVGSHAIHLRLVAFASR